MSEEKRIHWKHVHKLAVAEAAIEYIRLYPEASVIRAVREAQQVLPEELWRDNLDALARVPWIHEYMDKIRELRKSQEEQADSPQEPQTQREVPQFELVTSSPPEALQTPLVDLYSMPLDQLTSIWSQRFFTEQIGPQLETMAKEMFATKMASMIEQVQVTRGERGRLQIVTPEDVRRKMRSKVLIFGLIGSQRTTIRQRFGNELNLTFIEADHNRDNLISLAKSHDVGIVMTRFVSHPQWDQVKNNAPHTIPVSGTVTDLSNILTSLVKHGKEKVMQHNYNSKTFAVQ
jgi:hypothetical protein